MLAAAENDASEWANVAVVTAPREGNMTRGGKQIVRRVHVDPAEAVTVESQPGVGGISTGETRATGWRLGFDVAAHITRRQTERAQAGDLKVRKVLTYT